MRTVVKLGGDIVKGEIPPDFMVDLKKLVQTNQVILVHGGGDVVTEIANKLGKEQRFVVSPDGMKSRYTDSLLSMARQVVMGGTRNLTV